MPAIEEFVEVLTLETVGPDRFRGRNLRSDHQVVFGGQLLAQSIVAGLAGQEGKAVETLHTVFARSATPEAPLDVAVERVHTGRSVASSTVTISQGDRICTRSSVLLGAPEPDVVRHAEQAELPPFPNPGDDEIRKSGAWEMAVVGGVDLNDPEAVGPPELDVWVRFAGAPDDPGIEAALVAFSTDGFLVGTAMRPHRGVGQSQAHRTLSTGVLSHTITFHERCPAAEWHLLRQRSVFAGHGRAYGRGDIFRGDGQFAASFVQDAMLRARSDGGKL